MLTALDFGTAVRVGHREAHEQALPDSDESKRRSLRSASDLPDGGRIDGFEVNGMACGDRQAVGRVLLNQEHDGAADFHAGIDMSVIPDGRGNGLINRKGGR